MERALAASAAAAVAKRGIALSGVVLKRGGLLEDGYEVRKAFH